MFEIAGRRVQVDVARVAYVGVRYLLDGEPDASALGEGFGLELPDSLTALDLDGVLSKAYGTGRFRFVHYRTDSIAADDSGADRALVLQAERADRAFSELAAAEGSTTFNSVFGKICVAPSASVQLSADSDFANSARS